MMMVHVKPYFIYVSRIYGFGDIKVNKHFAVVQTQKFRVIS